MNLPLKGFPDAGLEVIQVIDGRPALEIGGSWVRIRLTEGDGRVLL